MSKKLTANQTTALTTLAGSENPLPLEAVGVGKNTINSLVITGMVEEITYEDSDVVEYFITQAGLDRITQPEAESEAEAAPVEEQAEATPSKPATGLSGSLMACLKVLADGEWHSAKELNTSHQNHGRLVDQGLAIMERAEDQSKKFQITALGREKLAG